MSVCRSVRPSVCPHGTTGPPLDASYCYVTGTLPVLFTISALCISTVTLSSSICSSDIKTTPATLPYHTRLATEVAICRDRMFCNKWLVINQIQYITVYSSRCSYMCEHWLMIKRCAGEKAKRMKRGMLYDTPVLRFHDLRGCGRRGFFGDGVVAMFLWV